MDQIQYAKEMSENPVYQSLQSITTSAASIIDQIGCDIEAMCGFYLTMEQRNTIVINLSNMLLDRAITHGFEDSSSSINIAA